MLTAQYVPATPACQTPPSPAAATTAATARGVSASPGLRPRWVPSTRIDCPSPRAFLLCVTTLAVSPTLSSMCVSPEGLMSVPNPDSGGERRHLSTWDPPLPTTTCHHHRTNVVCYAAGLALSLGCGLTHHKLVWVVASCSGLDCARVRALICCFDMQDLVVAYLCMLVLACCRCPVRCWTVSCMCTTPLCTLRA